MPIIIEIGSAPVRELPHNRGKSVQLFNPSNGAQNLDVHMNILNPGVKRGSIHYHRNLENVYVVLDGEGEIIDANGNHYPITAGQAVYFRPGENIDTHEIYNIGNDPLRFLEIYAPPHPKEAYVGNTLDRTKADHVVVATTE